MAISHLKTFEDFLVMSDNNISDLLDEEMHKAEVND